MNPRRREITMPDLCHRRYPFHYYTALNLLQKIGVNIENVELLAIGQFENYRGEVRRQEPAPGTTIKADTRIVLQVGVLGAVDEIPYQFFYGLRGVTAQYSGWEDRARRMMAPFDAAMVRRLAGAKYLELRFNFSFIELEQVTKFLEFYDFDLKLADSPEELYEWMNLMPGFNVWAGNPGMVEIVLQNLFGYKFRIVENIPVEHEIPDELRYRLGSKNERLGKEVVLGRKFSDLDSAYRVIISDFEPDQLPGLLPGAKTRRKIERVLGYCMPTSLVYEIEVRTEPGKIYLKGDEKRAVLGYSTYIKDNR